MLDSGVKLTQNIQRYHHSISTQNYCLCLNSGTYYQRQFFSDQKFNWQSLPYNTTERSQSNNHTSC